MAASLDKDCTVVRGTGVEPTVRQLHHHMANAAKAYPEMDETRPASVTRKNIQKRRNEQQS
jgi:hypothetical protein